MQGDGVTSGDWAVCPQPLSPVPLPRPLEWAVQGGLPGFSLILSVSPGRPRAGQWFPSCRWDLGLGGSVPQETLEVCH